MCLIAAFIGTEFSSSIISTKFNINLNINNKVLDQSLAEGLPKTKKSVEEKKKSLAQSEQSKNKFQKVFSRKKGVFASFLNSLSSGSIMLSCLEAVNSVVNSLRISTTILILLSLFLRFSFWALFINIFQVISRRIFLEGRIYEKIAPQRFLFLLKSRKWLQTVRTMFLKYIYQFLWSLTIIGGIIKHYSYLLVPYIIAENPTIKSKEALKLSQDMMRHHKLEAFKIDVSFLGWYFLGVITLGLTNIFFKNPYKVMVLCEFYENIRTQAKKNNITNVDKLCDTYLFQKAPAHILNKEYKDILIQTKKQSYPIPKLHGLKKIFVQVFGIATNDYVYEENYEKEQVRIARAKTYKNILAGRSYPSRLSTSPFVEKPRHIQTVNYLRHYSVLSLVLLFFIFSFIGWAWEVSLHLIKDGVFVNRGVLHGPWLPIYGSGGVLILLILNQFRKMPVLEFCLILILCGFVEYFTSVYLEIINNGTRWWDYSGYFLNLHGRICAEGLLVFALGGICVVYVLAPLIDMKLRKVNKKFLVTVATILLLFFLIDVIYSTKHPNSGVGISTQEQKFLMRDIKKEDIHV